MQNACTAETGILTGRSLAIARERARRMAQRAGKGDTLAAYTARMSHPYRLRGITQLRRF